MQRKYTLKVMKNDKTLLQPLDRSK